MTRQYHDCVVNNHDLFVIIMTWYHTSSLYLSQTVSQGFDHDAVVVVSLSLELLTQLLGTKHTHSKHPDVVLHAAVDGGHEVRQAQVRL